MTAIAAGYAEDYGRLHRDKDMWMKGLNAKVVVLIYVKESPRFKNPHTAYEDIEDVDVELARMQQNMWKVTQRNIEQGSYGPVEYRNNRSGRSVMLALKFGEWTGMILSEV
ncbi:hypothetical protein POJ06DRAFT_240465 [Lipomyces tetrasporus]|uniref:Uncharacterized protein n=1 Tax=Lipomyces tetrasporus TaxID=54092 RepID=A0AAD7QMT8_9ASCO|nr:uncharacterized protein POJ06DRAFT_240465 [Lipomyces tetrasporus]KAJ8097953.1 hypothetical protein POJ06DRAFT_240465 [Lipomyces tetrasporus]